MTPLLRRSLWAAVLLVSFVSVHELSRMPTGTMQMHFLDIGQGDATLIESPAGYRVLVDGGPDDAVLTQLSKHLPLLDRRIDLLVATHPDSDHTAGLVDVLKRYDVRHVLITGVWHDTLTYKTLLQLIAEKKIPVLIPDPAEDIRFQDGLTLDVIWPRPGLFGKAVDDTNDTAVVFRALCGSSSVLMTADIESPGETDILKTGADISAQVLKVAHHGSDTSSGTGFLLAAAPKVASISAGLHNKYGHPKPAIVARLKSLGIDVHVTALQGAFDL